MPYVSLDTVKMFVAEFEKLLSGYSIRKFTHGELINVYLINDSLVILVEAIGSKAPPLCVNAEEIYSNHQSNRCLDSSLGYNTYYILRIEELTHNDIGFKYNHTQFVNNLEKKQASGI